jgi:hypothetical protein
MLFVLHNGPVSKLGERQFEFERFEDQAEFSVTNLLDCRVPESYTQG